MKQKRSYDNYDYNEAYQYDLDKEIEKAAREFQSTLPRRE